MTSSGETPLSFVLPGTLFRLGGSCLLILAILDFVNTLIPFRLNDPAWQFQVLADMVERAPVPLLGLILIFYGELTSRAKWEIKALKWLSWGTLVAGIFYLLMIPIGFTSPLSISQQNEAQITAQLTQQVAQIQQLQQEVNRASESELDDLLRRNNLTRPPEISNSQELRNRLLNEAAATEKALKDQAQTDRQNKRFELIKNSFKWNLGALIIGFVFIRIWQATFWARRGQKQGEGKGKVQSRLALKKG
jgi:hypothetical protein